MDKETFFIFLSGIFVGAASLFLFLSPTTSIPFVSSFAGLDTLAPSDWIDQSDILVYEDMVIIRVKDARLSSYAPTGSMKPLLDYTSNGIQIKPDSPDNIREGDLISFDQGSKRVVHRVIEKGLDEEGIYFITGGDNTNFSDGKIRFKDIKYVTIGVLW